MDHLAFYSKAILCYKMITYKTTYCFMLRWRLSFYSTINEIVLICIHFSNKRLHIKLPPIIWYRIMRIGFATWLFQVDHRYVFLDNYNFRSNLHCAYSFFYCCNLFLLILLARVQISECILILERTEPCSKDLLLHKREIGRVR